MQALKIEAPNDSSRNPRRGWIVYNESGNIVSFVNENYNSNALKRAYPFIRMTDLGCIPTTAKFYNQMMRDYAHRVPPVQ